MIDASVTNTSSQRRFATASLALPMLMASMDTSISNIALPAIAAAFGATFAQVQWVIVIYLLSLTSLIVGLARLGDIVGHQRLLVTGLALFCSTSLLCSLSIDLSMLVVARGVQGVSAAIILSMTIALVGETVPAAMVGRTMGLLGTLSALGTSLGPSLGGLLIETAGWRVVFLANLPLGLVAIVLAWRGLPTRAARQEISPASFDFAGALFLAGALAAYALALTRGAPALAAVAALGLAAFLWIERRAKSPLVRLSLLGDWRLSTRLATSLLIATVMMATLIVGPFYVSTALGLGPSGVGLAMAAGPLAAAAAGIPAGRMVDRLGANKVVLAALAGVTAGLGLAAFSTGLVGYLGAIVTVTVSYAIFQAANNSTVMRLASAKERGLVAGLLVLSRNIGFISGAAGMGALFAAASDSATTASPIALADGMRAAFLVAAFLGASALAIALGSTFTSERVKLAPGAERRLSVASRSAEA